MVAMTWPLGTFTEFGTANKSPRELDIAMYVARSNGERF